MIHRKESLREQTAVLYILSEPDTPFKNQVTQVFWKIV